jgi:hypothetical protein
VGWVISSFSHICVPEVSTVMPPQWHLGADEGALWTTKNGVQFCFHSLHIMWKVHFLYVTNAPPGTHGFTSLLKEVELRIFIAVENPSTLARFEPANLGSKKHFFCLIWVLGGWVQLGPLGIVTTNGPVVPTPGYYDDDDDDDGEIGGMMMGRGNRSTRRKPVPAPLCPPQIPHD